MVGAGVAGLSCARDLARAGRRVIVVERARGVGGRCATRRLDGQPADLGPAWLHGSDPAFLRALDEVPAERLDGWPGAVEGHGLPCHPGSLGTGERRTAFAAGLTAFPKHLASGLDVRLQAGAEGLEDAAGLVRVHAGGEAFEAPTVVLTPPVPRTATLLGSAGADSPAVRGLAALLGAIRCEPALALVARYPDDTPLPPWDLWHPDEGDVLQVVSVDSRKRPAGAAPTLVVQTRARWSARRVERAPEAWTAEILAALAKGLGPWAEEPVATHAHAWRHARVDRSALWRAPALVPLSRGGRVVLAGEMFSRGGGVEGAFLSGRAAAARILEIA